MAIVQIDCATITVPLDRSGAAGGTARLQLIKATATEGPRLGTLFLIAGGPGQANDLMLDFMLTAFPGANRYDLIVVDQRGTGLSEPLNCLAIERGPSLDGADATTDRPITQCANELGEARGGYDTGEVIADMETVRGELGIEQISLFGVSYGTKVALAYARQYPSRVKSLLLDSVLPVNEPSAFDTESITAMRGALDNVCSPSRCKQFLRRPQTQLTALATKLRDEAIDEIRFSGDKPVKIKFGAKELYELLFAADFNLFIYHQLPGAISSALKGDNAALLRLGELIGVDGGDRLGVGRPHLRKGAKPPRQSRLVRDHESGNMVSMFSTTLNLTTSCEDLNAPWSRGTPIGQRQSAIDAAAAAIPDSMFLPFDRDTVKNQSLASLCRGWPETTPPPVLPTGPLPNVPTLALNGSLDVRTPASWAHAATASNPSAQVVEVPHVGHSTIGTDISGCALSLAKRFLIFGGTDGKCRNEPPPVPVATPAAMSSRSVKSLAGSCSGRLARARCRSAKRAMTAGYLAFRDSLDQFVIGAMDAGTGLRSGKWTIEVDFDDEDIFAEELPVTLELKGIEHVGGVLTSGRIRLDKYPRISGQLNVLDFSGGAYSVTVNGKVAYDANDDRITLSSSMRKGKIRLTRGKRGPSRSGVFPSAANLRVRSQFAAHTHGRSLLLSLR